MPSPYNRLSLIVALALLCSQNSFAEVVDHRIDKRNATETEGNFYVVFCARKTSDDKAGVGHAFVVWTQENDRRQYSTAQAFGFYPKSDKKLGFFGPVSGDVKNESTERDPKKLSLITHRLTVQVNKKVWIESQARIKQWETEKYDLFANNCVHFTHDVAADLGIITERRDTELPSDFLARLIESVR